MYFFRTDFLTGVSCEDKELLGTMTAAENVCYTLINVPNDSEPPSEVSLKTDLGKPFNIYFFYADHHQSVGHSY